jgi:threonine dehydrogenase-like Zn-dependent dehydrogenase
MRAAVYCGPRTVEIREVPDPRIEQPGDAILKMVCASMCGSDLYLYNGEVEELVAPGRTTLGHEICGEVVEVGPDVNRFAVGDRVTFPYSVSCGRCWLCRQGQTAHCQTTGSAIYGYGVAFGDLGGSHAEYVRVPLADGQLESVPDDVDDETAVFLSCNLPAAIIALDSAGIGASDSVGIVGCGPTGLLALQLARQQTRGRVLAFDSVPSRLALAKELGAEPIDVDKDPVSDAVAEATSGRGLDVVIEFAGRGAAFDLAVASTRPGGVVSGGGVYLERDHPVSLFDMFFKNLQLRLNGFANAKTAQWQALQLLAAGVIEPRTVLTDRVSLAELPDAARAFADREDGHLKMIIRP